ncbi:MAG: HAD-IIA family hydrolase [Verrucomicrobiota bacterium]
MKNWLRNIRHVALDMDGTIYKGGTLFDFTPPFLKTLGDLGIGHTFVTNNPSKSVTDYLLHLKKMGIAATREQLYTSAQCTLEFLREKYPAANRLFVLGTPSLYHEVVNAGFVLTEDSALDEPEIVVIAFDTGLTYSRLCRAAYWISKGKPYLATNPDRVCPTDEPTVLVDCASICACLNLATGREPTAVLGKPDSRMLQGILARHSLQPGELAMVGDRIYTDIAMAKNAGAMGVLVLSGEATMADAASSSMASDLIYPTLEEFGAELRAARRDVVLA